jgi:LPS export ABC transporter protein LptC
MIKAPRIWQAAHWQKAGVACCLCLLPFTFSCTNSMKEINELTGKAKVGEDYGEDVTILYSIGGKVKARLFTHTFLRAEASNPPYTEMKNGLKVEFYDDNAIVKSTLTARYGRWYERESNVLLRDSVHIINDKGDQLFTTELVWNQKLQKFFTEKPVRILTPTRTIYGSGMEANQDFSDYQITNPTGSIQVEKSQIPGQ